MRFDLALKKVLATNVTLFGHLMQYFAANRGENFEFLASLCRVGYQNNFYIAKTVDNMQFMPGDEESAEYDEHVIGQATEGDDYIEAPQLKGAPLADSLSMAELLKIINTPDYPVVDIQELLNGRNDKAGDANSSRGSAEETGGRSDNQGSAGPQTDWYNTLFGGNKSGQSISGQDAKGPDSPPDLAGQEG